MQNSSSTVMCQFIIDLCICWDTGNHARCSSPIFVLNHDHQTITEGPRISPDTGPSVIVDWEIFPTARPTAYGTVCRPDELIYRRDEIVSHLNEISMSSWQHMCIFSLYDHGCVPPYIANPLPRVKFVSFRSAFVRPPNTCFQPRKIISEAPW